MTCNITVTLISQYQWDWYFHIVISIITFHVCVRTQYIAYKYILKNKIKYLNHKIINILSTKIKFIKLAKYLEV